MLIFRFIKLTSFFFTFMTAPSVTAQDQQPPQPLTFETIHGTLIVDDPLAIELIQSPAMQRLKNILQYGVNEFISPSRYPYTRFDHSLGVYQLLKMHNASRKEQIAGLLHDISHTVFSHLADILFLKGFDQGNYQDQIHERFLEERGIESILIKYGFKSKDILPDTGEFTALEQDLPNLCADRIEYNLHAGDLEETLSPQDIKDIHKSLHFDGINWFFDSVFTAEKMANVSVHQTLNNWSSSDNILISKLISDAMIILAKENKITLDDIHFNSTDAKMWDTLCNSEIEAVQQLVAAAKAIKKCYSTNNSTAGQHTFKFKSRAIDPLINVDNKLYRLTDLSPNYKKKFENLKQLASLGWQVKIDQSCLKTKEPAMN